MYNFSDEDYEDKKPKTVPITIIQQRAQSQAQRYQDFLDRRQQIRRSKIQDLGYDYDSLTGAQQNTLLRTGKL